MVAKKLISYADISRVQCLKNKEAMWITDVQNGKQLNLGWNKQNKYQIYQNNHIFYEKIVI